MTMFPAPMGDQLVLAGPLNGVVLVLRCDRAVVADLLGEKRIALIGSAHRILPRSPAYAVFHDHQYVEFRTRVDGTNVDDPKMTQP